MATMVMTTPQTPLPTSNGHAVNGTEEAAAPIDISGLEESYDETCNQVAPRSLVQLLCTNFPIVVCNLLGNHRSEVAD